MKKNIFVALDFNSLEKALDATKKLRNQIAGVKIGTELYAVCGPEGLKRFKKLGVENVTPIFTRGVLIDLFAYYNNKLGLEQVITKEILQEALKNQGMAETNIRPGDVVFWRQGRDQLWYDDPDTYNKSTPGLNKEAADWLAGLNVVAVGSDSFAMEPFPPINNRLAEVHAIFLMKHGIYMFENLDLRTLSDEKVYEFAFSFSPIPFVGAQGSPARPFALY